MVTFDSTDLDNAVSESGVVHESVSNTDHDNASLLKQGYSLASPYKSASAEGIYACMEDSGSTLYDFSGNNRDASLTGGTLNSTDFLGTSSVFLDGVDDYADTGVDYASIFSTSGAFTVTGWFIWQDGGDTEERLCAQTGGGQPFLFEINGFETGSPFEFRMSDSSGAIARVFGGSPSTGTRYFYAGTWDGSTMELYTDIGGSLGSEGTASISSLEDSTATTTIGTGGSGTYFDGNLWMQRLDSTAWTQSELQSYYDVVATQGTLTTQYKAL